MTAQTSTERARKLRKERLAAGLAEVRGIWARPQAHLAIKRLIASAPELTRWTRGALLEVRKDAAPDDGAA